MTTRMVTVTWHVQAEIEANIPVSDADVREWLGESDDYEVSADEVQEYAEQETDDGWYDLKNITDWLKVTSEVKEQA